MSGENLEKRIEEDPRDICRKVDAERASQRIYARQAYFNNVLYIGFATTAAAGIALYALYYFMTQ
jgi:GH43 family beta-xylosidase